MLSYPCNMMMTFYKKSVHSFLGFTSSLDIPITPPQPQPPTIASSALGLASATTVDMCRSPNVVESAAVKSTAAGSIKKDPRGIGFIDDIGGGVNGLMSCTESLGFESSDERRVDDDDHINISSVINKDDIDLVRRRTRISEKTKVKNYPPPIPSLNQNFQPNFFLRPVRKDGRLELTEVRLDRPEILRASREDGRLKLHLVAEDEDQCEEEDDEEVEKDMENCDEDVEEIVNFPGSCGGGEGFRSCHEAVSHHSRHHHHHSMHAWRQHCVPTR